MGTNGAATEESNPVEEGAMGLLLQANLNWPHSQGTGCVRPEYGRVGCGLSITAKPSRVSDLSN